MDLDVFLAKISIYAIPVLLAITLHEVAHGWSAKCCGDRTAELLGRLSLNPLRHIDPIGTLLVPGFLLALQVPVFGWAKPVPVSIAALAHPRRAAILVAAAGPAANFAMTFLWCGVLAAVVRMRGGAVLDDWVILMAQAGIVANVVLALFNLLPIPPLDGGRIVVALLPSKIRADFEKYDTIGLVVVIALSITPLIKWLFNPAYWAIGHVISAVWLRPVA